MLSLSWFYFFFPSFLREREGRRIDMNFNRNDASYAQLCPERDESRRVFAINENRMTVRAFEGFKGVHL